MTQKYIRGRLLTFDNPKSYSLIEDGLIKIKDKKIENVGNFKDYNLSQEEIQLMDDQSGNIIMPGFIDTHVHYPQLEVIGSFGQQLLGWLEKYTFPAEGKFCDKKYAQEVSKKFLQSAVKNGTTTMVVFTTVFKESVDALFEQAENYDMEIIAGKVMMDRNCPEYLRDTPETGYRDSIQLIQKWHRKGRFHYAVTPRFAPTSSPQQLGKCKQLLQSYPDLYFQTHANENHSEIQWVKQLFPQTKNYMEVYDSFDLVTQRGVFAHCIHLEDCQYDLIKSKDATVSICAQSNLFLGSGLFNLDKSKQKGLNLSIGSDVGGGTTLSILKNLASTYKVVKLNKQTLKPIQAFYYATLGAAKGLKLDDHIGKISSGYYADLIVLNPLLIEDIDLKGQQSIEEILFTLMMMGDQKCVVKTYISGKER